MEWNFLVRTVIAVLLNCLISYRVWFIEDTYAIIALVYSVLMFFRTITIADEAAITHEHPVPDGPPERHLVSPKIILCS